MSYNRIFLTADWRYLALLNYEVDPSLLSDFVPQGTELDRWNGKTFVSLVGFRFLKTAVCGISIPLHRNFDEINLRFYVRRIDPGEIPSEARRGVVFIREIVPRWAIATIAKRVYGEKYQAFPMKHRVETRGGSGLFVEYGWRSRAGWNLFSMGAEGTPALPEEGSEERFITEHYWGYSAQSDGGTVEYRVAHIPWRVWNGFGAKFEGDSTELYGRDLAAVLLRSPSSSFLAEGSAVTVSRGQRI